MSTDIHISDADLFQSAIPSDLIISTRQPSKVPFGEDSLELHAARIMLLLKYAGGRTSSIVGRTKLAKLDFFIRYPSYLSKATGNEYVDSVSTDSPMIRYKYGPWDEQYYNIFALLIAKELISIEPTKKGDKFSLTKRGKAAVDELETLDFEELIERCKVVNGLFKGKSGTYIKNYIYTNYPEIVAKQLGDVI